MNTMLHMFFCPKLPLFWHNMHELALALSIYFPSEPHLLKWAMVSAHMSSFQKQPMINTWQAVCDICVNIIYYDHCFPKPHVNTLINQFNSRLIELAAFVDMRDLRSLHSALILNVSLELNWLVDQHQ